MTNTRFRLTAQFPRKLEELGVRNLLGYEDSHSFFRAFQQWEGQTPGEWRARRARRAGARIVARTV